MINNEQNRFYTTISAYYAEIFPYRPMQLTFMENALDGLYGKNVLEIGCATGELAYHLAMAGANVVGIDLNEDLLARAASNKVHPNLKFQKGNMLEVEKNFTPGQFDAVSCFGNTLVHLPAKAFIKKMFEGVKTVLKPGGSFLIQILHYDYILDEQVTELPLIDTENIRFIRKYKIREGHPSIRFQTDLYVKAHDEVITNETSLLGLRSADLVGLLKGTGFSDIRLYSNFKGDPLGEKHLPLVLSCRK